MLDVGGQVQELPQEALELDAGALVDGLGWSRDGQVGGWLPHSALTVC